MANRCDGKVAYFSLDPKCDAFRKHIDSEGMGVTCDAGWLVVHDGRKRIPIVEVSDIPATYGGISDANIKNALAAAMISYVSGVRVEDIRQGLKTFDASYHLTPGRLNLVDVSDFRVLLDYAHNVAAYEEVARFVGLFKKRRSIGVIAAPGDRQDENLWRMGEIAGVCFDHVVVKEDDETRGRDRGVVAKIIMDGVNAGRAASGRSANEGVETVLSEKDAVERGLEAAGPDDLVVILADKLERTWEQVTLFRAAAGETAGAVVAAGAHASPPRR
jgi:cyanophycin synthetase